MSGHESGGGKEGGLFPVEEAKEMIVKEGRPIWNMTFGAIGLVFFALLSTLTALGKGTDVGQTLVDPHGEEGHGGH